MSKAVNSPTARLLQSSRLFSLPRPLPQPPLESLASTGVYKASESATRPYPTHQAIATPSSSLHRGDWGLKRPLPGRKTRHTSTPHIRVQAQDTFEHITDFTSAADHTQTEAKWAEMGLPMIQRSTKRVTSSDPRIGPVSVYETHLDNTDPDAPMEVQPEQRRSGGRRVVVDEPKQRQRWKYAGPWIAGMQEGEFNQYLAGKLANKKHGWRDFLRSREVETKLRQVQQRARHEGNALTPNDIQQLKTRLRPTDEQLTDLEKRLRDDHASQGLSSNLTALITEFLDLPSVSPSESNPLGVSARMSRALSAYTDSDSAGPPSTHPAAGLSHIRTNAIMENHPLHGPQAHRSPVQARVVRPRSSMGQVTEYRAKLGVGGFVTDDPASRTLEPGGKQGDSDAMAHQLDLDAVGGNKMWVQPDSAFVDENGRVQVQVLRGDWESVAVRKGDVEAIHEAKRGPRNVPPPTAAPAGMGDPFAFAATPTEAAGKNGGASGYGQASMRRPNVTGFDEELRRQGGGREMDQETAASRLRDLFERGSDR